MAWENEFYMRMKQFESSIGKHKSNIPASIKIRVTTGCYHREHSPIAYKIIDDYLKSHPEKELSFQEHESGPEILVYISVISSGIVLAANVIEFITAIINARTEGQKQGDHPSGPLELIIRGFGKDGKIKEERILQIPFGKRIKEETVHKAINAVTLFTEQNSKGKSKKKK